MDIADELDKIYVGKTVGTSVQLAQLVKIQQSSKSSQVVRRINTARTVLLLCSSGKMMNECWDERPKSGLSCSDCPGGYTPRSPEYDVFCLRRCIRLPHGFSPRNEVLDVQQYPRPNHRICARFQTEWEPLHLFEMGRTYEIHGLAQDSVNCDLVRRNHTLTISAAVQARAGPSPIQPFL